MNKEPAMVVDGGSRVTFTTVKNCALGGEPIKGNNFDGKIEEEK